MTRSDDRATLPPAVEQLLKHVDPTREPDWERLSESIARRLDEVAPGRSGGDDWLLQAPLPLQNGERVLRADGGPRVELVQSPDPSTVGIPSDHRSLREIAEAAMAESRREPSALPPPHRAPERSGIQLRALATRATTPGESLAPRSPTRGPGPSAEDEAAEPGRTAPPASASASAARRRPAWLAGSLALMATLPVAAAIALWLVGGSSTEPAVTTAVTTTVVTVGNSDVETPAAPAEERQARALAPAHSKDDAPAAAREVAMLPLEAALRPEAALPLEQAAPRGASKPRTPPVRSEPAPARPAPPAAVAPERAEAPLVPAAELGARPDHPSVGAAQAAVGSTLGSARLCIVGQLSPSQATVVFGSNGRVLSVRISGPAAGTAAESCIQKAMAHARVQPFTDETFSVRTTVRP